jgi:hypothetical protein
MVCYGRIKQETRTEFRWKETSRMAEKNILEQNGDFEGLLGQNFLADPPLRPFQSYGGFIRSTELGKRRRQAGML